MITKSGWARGRSLARRTREQVGSCPRGTNPSSTCLGWRDASTAFRPLGFAAGRTSRRLASREPAERRVVRRGDAAECRFPGPARCSLHLAGSEDTAGAPRPLTYRSPGRLLRCGSSGSPHFADLPSPAACRSPAARHRPNRRPGLPFPTLPDRPSFAQLNGMSASAPACHPLSIPVTPSLATRSRRRAQLRRV